MERMFMCSGERMLLVLQRSALVGPQGLQAAAFHNLGYARSSPARLSQPGRTTVPSAPTSRLMLHGLRAHPLCRDSDNLVSRPSAARPSRRRYSLPLPLFATSPPQHHHRPRLRSVAYPPPPRLSLPPPPPPPHSGVATGAAAASRPQRWWRRTSLQRRHGIAVPCRRRRRRRRDAEPGPLLGPAAIWLGAVAQRAGSSRRRANRSDPDRHCVACRLLVQMK